MAKSVRIVGVGCSGAGITSTLKTLVPHLPMSDAFYINEYKVKYPNNKLLTTTIIDTPGFNNDEQDTANQSISEALTHHLIKTKHNYSDNVALIVSRFDDNRFEGASSHFAKTLKQIQPIFAVGSETSNSRWTCILVLTHAYSVLRQVTRDEEESAKRLNAFFQVFSSFARDLVCPFQIVAENEGTEYNLEVGREGYILPNNDIYPGNLVGALCKIIACSKTAFDPFQSSKVCQVETAVNKISPAQRQITNLPERPTGNRLVEKMKTQIQYHPHWEWGTIEKIGKAIIEQNIFSEKDLPKTKTDTILFLQRIPRNQTSHKVLTNLFKMSIPVLTDLDPLIGQGFDIRTGGSVPGSIFKFSGNQQLSVLGYLLPAEVDIAMLNSIVDVCTFYNSEQEYLQGRFEDLSISGTIGAYEGSPWITPGYNVLDKGQILPMTVTGVKEHRKFELKLKPEFCQRPDVLSEDFCQHIKSLPVYTGNETITGRQNKLWHFEHFLSVYGTHVVVSCFGGGAIDVALPGNSQSHSQSDVLKCIDTTILSSFVNAMSKIDVKSSDLLEESALYKSIKIDNAAFSVSIRGGSPPNENDGLLYSSTGFARRAVKAWDRSITTTPVMLTTKMGLIPISDFVKKMNLEIGKSLERAVQDITHFTDWKYIFPTTWPVFSRSPYISVHGNKYSKQVPFQQFSYVDYYKTHCNIL